MSVAVVMTVYQTRVDWLAEAVTSAAGQLDFRRDELCVVNDGDDNLIGEDPGMDQVCGFRILHCDHLGIGPASNFGIRLTDAPLISRLDADDRMMPGAIAALRNYLFTHPDVDVVSGGMRYIGPDGQFLGNVQYEPMEASPRHLGRVVHGGCMFRRSLWERVGGYPDMTFADWHFWEACEAAGAKFTVLDQLVIERRIHEGSFSYPHSPHLQNWYKKVKR